MKHLPSKPNKNQKITIKAVRDYFGEISDKEKMMVKCITLFLLNRKKGVKIEKEWQADIERIKCNISDPTYRESLMC